MKKPVNTGEKINQLWGAVKKLEMQMAKGLYDEAYRTLFASVSALSGRVHAMEGSGSKEMINALKTRYTPLEAHPDMDAWVKWANETHPEMAQWAELAARLEKAVPEKGQFCVIGEKAKHQYPISRTWHSTRKKAEEYAASLIRNSDSTQELLVVQVVSAVKRKQVDVDVVPF